MAYRGLAVGAALMAIAVAAAPAHADTLALGGTCLDRGADGACRLPPAGKLRADPRVSHFILTGR